MGVAGALGGETGQEGGAFWMGFTLEARPRSLTAPEDQEEPMKVAEGHSSGLRNRLEAGKRLLGAGR